jgi:hypothetical protein
MRGIAEEKDAPLPEALCDPVVHVVRREPVYAADVEPQASQDSLAYLGPAELLAFLLGLGPNGADQPDVPFFLEREDADEVALVDRDVQLAIQERPARLHVGDVEQVLVGAARVADAELLADGGVRAVAAGQECGLARRPLQIGHNAAVRLLEADEPDAALDLHAQLFESIDQEALVLVLRIDEPIWIRALAHAQRAKPDVRRLPASRPEIRRGEHEARFDDFAGETELAVELQRPRLHRHRARGRAWLCGLVDDADPYAQLCEPESEHQTGRARANDENVGVDTRQLFTCSLAFEELNGPLVLASGSERLEGTQVLALAGATVLLARVEPVHAGLELADHASEYAYATWDLTLPRRRPWETVVNSRTP